MLVGRQWSQPHNAMRTTTPHRELPRCALLCSAVPSPPAGARTQSVARCPQGRPAGRMPRARAALQPRSGTPARAGPARRLRTAGRARRSRTRCRTDRRQLDRCRQLDLLHGAACVTPPRQSSADWRWEPTAARRRRAASIRAPLVSWAGARPPQRGWETRRHCRASRWAPARSSSAGAGPSECDGPGLRRALPTGQSPAAFAMLAHTQAFSHTPGGPPARGAPSRSHSRAPSDPSRLARTASATRAPRAATGRVQVAESWRAAA